MLTFRRGLLLALAFVTFFVLLRSPKSRPPGSSRAEVVSKTLSQTKTSQQRQRQQDGSQSEPLASASSSSPSRSDQSYNTPPDQAPLSEIAARPLRQRLAYYFPYELQAKFPAYIWQTWRVPPSSGDFPEDWRNFEASWTEQHPGFVHEVVSDDAAVYVLRHLYSGMPEVIEAYESLPKPVLKADFFRYLILLARGGIYSDIDTIALKSAVEWVPTTLDRSTYGLVVGIEADPDREDWADWYSRRIQFAQWTIQAKPGHPVLREVVAKITEDTLGMKQAGTLTKFDMKNVVEFTGPALWTDTIFQFFNDPEWFDMSAAKGNITWRQFTGIEHAKKVGDVVVLPITCFSPGVDQMGAKDVDDPMAFVQHIFEGSWKPESERHIGQ